MMILKRCFMRLLCRHSVFTLICFLAVMLYVFTSVSFSVKYPQFHNKELDLAKGKTGLEELHGASNINKNESSQSSREEVLYIEEEQMDLPGGDIECSGEETCRDFPPSSLEQAKIICNSFGSRCKGFVYTIQTGKIYLKQELTGKMISSPVYALFIKKAFYQGQDDTCAVALDQFQSLADECRLPEMDPNDEDVIKLIGQPTPLQCPGYQLTRYRGGILELTEEANRAGNILSMAYQPIYRPKHNDWGFELGNEISLRAQERRFELQSEFIRVQLRTSEGAKQVEYHAQIIPKAPELANNKAGLPLSVVIIGFDSLSAVHFQRALPEVHKFMTDELNTVFLKGYSIVGDGTTPALTALMTGKFESELPEARRGFPGAAPLDHWPHIFKDFKQRGYSTLFSEDCPEFGSFNYRLHGFTEPPTDHFSRYFWQAAGKTSPHCIRSQPQHQIHFNYIKSFFEAYRQQPKFGLFFFTDISHNNLQSIYSCSSDFLALLRGLSEGNLLNDTLLIVMSDHGFRYGQTRATFQGRFEERLPLMSLTFPKWFQQQHGDVMKTLKENSNIVTSPFDLYATFKHMLTYPQAPVDLIRGESLLSNINKSRHCERAGVAEHYCPCVQWKEIDTRSSHVQRAAQVVVDHVNDLTSSDPLGLSLCSRLQLHEISAAYQKVPNLKFAQFMGSYDIHGRKPMFSTGKVHECLYQVQIQTVPGNGLYEASVSFHDGKYRVIGDISRINLYGEQPRCIVDKRPYLRKYCLCKDYHG